MIGQHDRANRVLASLMAEAGLSPRTLAREVNRLAGSGTVAETAPYHWRDSGGIPREPLPAFVAHVLSRRLGRIVGVRDLWQGGAAEATRLLPADAGMGQSWTLAATLSIAEDWLLGGLLDRRVFLAVSGDAMARAVGAYLATTLPPTTAVDSPVTADDAGQHGPNHLDCQAGYAMILAGRRSLEDGDRSGGLPLLRRGEALLRTGAHARPVGVPSQRRTLYEGSWLALGYTAHGKLDDACAVVMHALPRLQQVRSPRSLALLTTLNHEFRRRRRHHLVGEVLPQLESALARQAR